MSLVFNAAANTAQTHIFIIGVGGYPFLKGGETAIPQEKEAAQNLGQLTSPGVSVGYFYDKVMEYHRNADWAKPLGSVEILLTLPPNAAVPASLPNPQIDKANLVNIRNAYFQWQARCDANEDNIALFFYSGHGLEKTEHFLLTDDFGQIPANPWMGAFNFDKTRLAFRKCKAKTQLFFVDACRQITSDMLLTDLVIPGLDNPGLDPDSQFNLTIKATASTLAAYGKTGEPTYFTKALVSGFDGLVATQQNGQWLIQTGALSNHINTLMEFIDSEQFSRQRCQTQGSGNTAIIKRNSRPDAWLQVSCDPANALPVAEFSCIENGVPNPLTRPPQPDPWKFVLKAGIYNVAAKFQNNEFPNGEKLISAIPPITIDQIPCK